MAKVDWETVSSFIEGIGSSNKTITFPKVQDTVKLTNRGNVDVIYTIGTQSGTLAPNGTVTVKENISSFTVRASTGSSEVYVWAAEAGTEKEEEANDLPSKVESLETQLAHLAKLPQSFRDATDTDDTAMINRALAGGGKVRIPYRITPYIISSPLLIGSDTTLEVDNAATIYLQSGSNCRMIENKNKSTQSNLTRQDKNITIIGGIWDGNGDNQIKWLPDGGTCTGSLFSGVENLIFKPFKLLKMNTYAAWFCNVKNIVAEGGEVYQGDVHLTGTNRDGIHFQGPSENIVVRNWKIRSHDDCVAINADDVEQGTYSTKGNVKNVLIENIEMNDCNTGIRLMSITSRVDDITVRNIKGTTYSFAVSIGSYQMGASDFGNLLLDKINVSVAQGASKPPYLIHVNGKVDHLKIKNFTIPADFAGVYYQGISIGQDSGSYPPIIGKLEIDGLEVPSTSEDSARYVLVAANADIGILEIKNNRAFNVTSPSGVFPYVVVGAIDKLLVCDSYFHKTTQGVFLIDGATIGAIDYKNVTLEETVNPNPKIINWSNTTVGSVVISDFQGRTEMKNAQRDLTLSGKQTITGLKGVPKKITVKAVVLGTKKMNIGTWDGVYQEGVYSNANGDWKDGTYWAIVMEDTAGNHTIGTISNVKYGQFDIDWTKGGTGATGTALLKIEATY